MSFSDQVRGVPSIKYYNNPFGSRIVQACASLWGTLLAKTYSEGTSEVFHSERLAFRLRTSMSNGSGDCSSTSSGEDIETSAGTDPDDTTVMTAHFEAGAMDEAAIAETAADGARAFGEAMRAEFSRDELRMSVSELVGVRADVNAPTIEQCRSDTDAVLERFGEDYVRRAKIDGGRLVPTPIACPRATLWVA